MAFQSNKIHFLALVSILGICLSLATSRSIPGRTMAERHEHWMKQYGRVYKDESEKAKRFKIFKDNVEFIESSNLDKTKSYKLGINKFADLENEEFRASLGGYKKAPHKKPSTHFRYENVTKVPASRELSSQWPPLENVIWPSLSVSSQHHPIRQDGWVFSAVAAIEGRHCVHVESGVITSLSEQNIIDCGGAPNGCKGGRVEQVFQFVIRNGRLATDGSYPYRRREGRCTSHIQSSLAVKLSGFQIGIDPSLFQFYETGVLTG